MRSVICPWCYASVGEPCVVMVIGGHKREVTYIHHARALLWAKEKGEKR